MLTLRSWTPSKQKRLIFATRRYAKRPVGLPLHHFVLDVAEKSVYGSLQKPKPTTPVEVSKELARRLERIVGAYRLLARARRLGGLARPSRSLDGSLISTV